MSLVGTLGKMAVGMMVAKGVKGMMGGGSQQGGGALGGLLGSLGGGGQSGGGLGGLLGSIAGGGQQQSGGGLGGLLSGLAGGQKSSAGAGGLGDLLGSLTGGGSSAGGLGGLGGLAGMLGGAGGQSSGGLGGILDSLGGGQAGAGGLGGLLNNVLQGNKIEQPSSDQEQQAEVMLRAMISAAKADGQIDAEEQQKIAKHLDDISPEEVELVRSMMSEPMNMQSLVNSIPKGMEQQAYFMSLLAIDLDSKPEAQYLHDLAQGLNISQQASNSIHEKLGAPVLYA